MKKYNLTFYIYSKGILRKQRMHTEGAVSEANLAFLIQQQLRTYRYEGTAFATWTEV